MYVVVLQQTGTIEMIMMILFETAAPRLSSSSGILIVYPSIKSAGFLEIASERGVDVVGLLLANAGKLESPFSLVTD